MNNELQENIGSGKPTGSVLKEIIAVSVTISKSVRKQLSRIFLRALLPGIMKEMRREPKSQRKECQWEKVSIAMQGLPQRNLHQFIL